MKFPRFCSCRLWLHSCRNDVNQKTSHQRFGPFDALLIAWTYFNYSNECFAPGTLDQLQRSLWTSDQTQRIGHPLGGPCSSLALGSFKLWNSLRSREVKCEVFSANRMVWDGVTMNYEPRTIQPKQILLNSMFVWMCVDVHSDQYAYNLNLERFVKLQVWRYMKLPSNWSCRQCLDKVHL